MSFCVRRTFVVLAVAATLPCGAIAQDKSAAKKALPSDEYSLLAYMQSVGSQMAARTCERGIRDYRKTFDAAYKTWAKKNDAAIKRGATLFRRAKNQEWKNMPVSRVEANEIAKGVETLKKPPADSSPLSFDAATRNECGQLLKDLALGS